MIYLVTELRLEGGWKRFRLCRDGAGITDERAGTGPWLIIDILEHALLVSASKEYYFYPKNRNSNEGEEGFFFLSFFKREIRFTTKNRGCNKIDIERRRIRTRSRRNIWRRGDDFWRKITKQFAILVWG